MVAATSTEGAEKIKVSPSCRMEGGLGHWSSFLHQELAAFCTHFLAVPILSPEGVARLLLEVQEGGVGRSATCVREGEACWTLSCQPDF